MKRIFYTVFCSLFAYGLMAQSFNPKQVAESFMQENLGQLNLTDQDIQNYTVTDMYTSKHNGVTHMYLTQTHNDIQVYNAILNLNITKEGVVVHHGNRFISDLQSKIESESFSTTPVVAVTSVVADLELDTREALRLAGEKDGVFTFEQTSYSNNDIKVEKKYYLTESGSVVPTWDVTLDVKGNPDYWNTKVHAGTGEIVNKHNYTIYCNHAVGAYSRHHAKTCTDKTHTHSIAPEKAVKSSGALLTGQYNVYPEPFETPLNGPQMLVDRPVWPGSPFGWHDTNGVEGAEFTITRGNNVHAFSDESATDTSQGDEPDGGPELIFNFPHDPALEPAESRDALITNLFYWNNLIHDLTYEFGFDEASGNFQANNYGNGGLQGDQVNAHGLDGSGTNNANFGTPPDGSSGQMQMFLWDQGNSSALRVESPEDLAGGVEFGGVAADWGYTDYSGFDVTADVVIAFDGNVQNATQCCDDIVNDAEVMGNFALIDRGGCEFGSKALNAQNNGAVACLICNVPGASSADGNDLIGMNGGSDGAAVTIPAFFLARQTCDRIRAQINDGVPVTMTVREEEMTGPARVGSSLDNGIIAHEYGHGISNRLTGGPSAAGCLTNDEQMGEGWSDLFGLFFTVEEGDTGEDARGIGAYVLGETVDGRGIRRFPYSTDLSVNPETYNDIIGTTAPHPLGSVWVAAVWDMYWALVDVHGFDTDLTNKSSGNAIAIQLVMDGMKFQPCSPGFFDGRDAIIAADQINNNGENVCLIWDVFARRGMGIDADQGSSQDRNDGTEGFEPLATCIQELKIDKTIADFTNPLEPVEVTLLIRNHTLETKQGVIVTDQIPGAGTYIGNSANIPPSQVNGNELTWDLGDMETLDEITITYTYLTSADEFSTSLFLDDIESGPGNFTIDLAEGDNIWLQSGTQAFSGFLSWQIDDFYVEPAGFNQGGDTRLVLSDLEVIGDNPALRFWHQYDTEPGIDGGFIEISTDGQIWNNVTDLFFRNGYNAVIDFSTLAIPNLDGFTGSQTGDWVDSYIDLSDFVGQTVSLRWRFATDGVNSTGNPAWFIDDVELLDVLSFETEACATAEDGDQACVQATTIANSDGIVNTEDDILAQQVSMSITPNPASDYVTINLNADQNFDANLSILTIDGKLLTSNSIKVNEGTQVRTIDTTDFPKGFYVVRLESGNAVMTQKLVIQ